jgi:DNA (cytosine-5)-methyltransferase 1
LTCNHEAPIAAYSTSGAGYWREGIGALRGRTQDSHENIALSVALRGRDGGATAELGGEVAGTLRTSGGGDKAHMLAFSCKDNGRDVARDLSPTLRSMGHAGSHQNGGGQMAVCITGDITHTLKAEGFDASEDGTGRGQPIVANSAYAVRRLTPKECARLQAFSDDYLSQVIVRGKPMADGPMYKALGNSMCTKNMRWIGERIQMVADLAAMEIAA